MKSYYIIPLVLLILSSCIKDKPQEPVKTAVSINQNDKVLITNEGNYGWNNAGVSVYDPAADAVVEDYYKQQNNNNALGDVCQSITKYNNSYYIVVNNSGKIVVTDAVNFTKTATISGFNSPRYLLPITYNKAYVSDLYANSIQIVDLNSNSISGSIACNGWTEEMAMIYNKVFVANTTTGYCYVLDAATNAITDSIMTSKGAASVLIDKNSKVWVLSGGNSTSGDAGTLTRIDPVSLQKELSLSFASGDSPQKLCINKTRDTLYYLNHGVCRFPVTETQLPTSVLISQGSKLFYGLGINPKNYTIYVSDAIDYVQKSKIEIYQANGTFIRNFNAGIISNGFVFE